MDKTIKTLTEVLQESKKEGTTPYDTTAEVVRIEGKTAWVHIPGGIDETPVSMTIDARAGDIVQVRVSGGRAWITGNASAPPTDDTIAREARTKANSASELSESAKTQAEDAARVAGNTSQHFWFTGTGADTGAHITEVDKETWLLDPSNGGGNLLARSNGVALRDGLTELSKYMLTTNSLGHIVPTMMMSENNRLVITADETPGEITASIVADPGGIGIPAYIIFTADQSDRNVSIAGDTSISGDMQTSGDITADGDIYTNNHNTPIGYYNSNSGTVSVGHNSWTDLTGDLTLNPGTFILLGRAEFASNANGRRAVCWADATSGTPVNDTISIHNQVTTSGTTTLLQSVDFVHVSVVSKYRFRGFQYSTSGTNLSTSYKWALIRIA